MKKRAIVLALILGIISQGTIVPVYAESNVETEAAISDMTPEELFNAGMACTDDLQKGMELILQSAEAGYAEAQRIMGEFNQSGDYGEPNYEEALKWDQLAAAQGNARAMTNLGLLFLNGWGIEQDYAQALSYFEQGTEAGDEKAPRHAGRIYENGYGVEVDMEKAADYYQLASDRGDITGKYYLGRLYELGEGVEQDYEKAFELYTESAQRNDHVSAGSQLALGNLYENGFGTEQDVNKAMEWYQRALDNGNEEAQSALDELDEKVKQIGYLEETADQTYKMMAGNTLAGYLLLGEEKAFVIQLGKAAGSIDITELQGDREVIYCSVSYRDDTES